MQNWIDQMLGLWDTVRDWATENQMKYQGRDPSLDWFFDVLQDGPPAPSWSASDDQVKEFQYLFSTLPGYGDWVRAADAINYWSDYFKNTGLDWSDMRYPTRNSGSGSGMGVLNFVSSNITRLYR